MSKFHSTMSRRDFMKAIGLGAAGAATAAATVPVFRDLDEAAATEASSLNKNPWWVKERDFNNPTVEINWQDFRRQDGFKFKSLPRPSVADFENAGVVGGYMTDLATPAQALALYDYCEKEFPGWDKGPFGSGDLRSTALDNASKFLMMGQWPGEMNQGNGVRVNIRAAITAAGGAAGFTSFVGPQLTTTLRPQDYGVPRWEDNEENNLKTCRAALRFFGAQNVGAGVLDEYTIKTILSYSKTPSGFNDGTGSGGKPILVKDVEDAYENDDEIVIPSKCKYILTFSARQSFEATRRQAGITEGFAVWYCYARYRKMICHLQEFMRGLGYQCLDLTNLYLSNPLSVLVGMGEHGRMSSPIITPKNGVTDRVMWSVLTDMPLSPSKPIDFGATKFCETCGICADSCPFGLIQKGSSSWENSAALGNGLEQGTWKGWRTDNANCPHCPTCQGTCPFSSISKSFIHEAVKATASTTSLFNGFFTSMEKFMGYGRKPQWSWWDLDEPTYGWDTTA